MRGFVLLGASGALAGCAAIAGFEDFTADCPSGNVGCQTKEAGGAPASGGLRGSGGSGGSGGSDGSGGDGSGGALGSGGAGDAAAGGSASSGGAAVWRGLDPPGTHGPAMALVARGDGTYFWIDRTEVTVGQFAEYLAADAPLRGAVCEVEPGTGPFQCDALPEPADPVMPRTCVDWCAADGFCAWAGKELCGDDADQGASASRADLLLNSDFYAACAPAANAVYGCGEDCAPSACNGADSANRRILPVGASPSCCVPDACGAECAIADLSGNVAEWTAACKPLTADGNCVVRGGDFESNAAELECRTITNALARRSRYSTVGFRCCAPASL